MPKAYPVELRRRVVDAYANGEGSYREIAERFMVGEATVDRWIALDRRTGSVAPRRAGGARRPRLVDSEGEELIRTLLKDLPDLTLPEICSTYAENRGVVVSRQTMGETLARMGFTKKKQRSVLEHRNARTS